MSACIPRSAPPSRPTQRPTSVPTGFDLAAYREKVRVFNLAQPREEVAEATDVDADGVPCRLFTPRPTPRTA